jgi:hypothetical protein
LVAFGKHEEASPEVAYGEEPVSKTMT